jgi:hypothetical protein
MLKTDTCVIIWIDGVETMGYIVGVDIEDGVIVYDIDTDDGLIQGKERNAFVLFAPYND